MPKLPTNGNPEDEGKPTGSQTKTRRATRSWPNAADLQAMDAAERKRWERLIANELS